MLEKKKNGFLKAAFLMLTVIMLSACFLPGTLAKYYSQGKTGLKLEVATWNVAVEEGSADPQRIGEIDLSSLTWTINQETDVTAAPAEGKIAPGTWGYAEIRIVNMSDVDAIVTISGVEDIEELGSTTEGLGTLDDSGLHFKVIATSEPISDPGSYDGMKTDTTPVTDIFTSDGHKFQKATSDSSDDADSIYLYVCFEWLFEILTDSVANSDVDEAHAKLGEDSYSFDFSALTITAWQAKEGTS